MMLRNGLMDWEKLLEEELCWDCWKKDWKEGAICWKAIKGNRLLLVEMIGRVNRKIKGNDRDTYERQFHQRHRRSLIGSSA